MTTMEDVDTFRLRARDWLAENMPRLEPDAPSRPGLTAGDDDEEWQRARELQKLLYAGGFAGICFPVEYGGLGLTPEHQRAFSDESIGYEMPLKLNIPTFSICAATLLDMGSEEQKRDRIGAAIRGEEILVQLLSEPRGGSDLAGVVTRATRDGDTWILNGAKTWSTSAYAGDWGLCLARTDWDAPKHRGLTMFLVPLDAEGITMRRIAMVNGATEFCEEFFDDVVLPADSVVGEVNEGWSVASRQLVHERTAVGGGSPFISGRRREGSNESGTPTPFEIARLTGGLEDPAVKEAVGSWRTLDRVHHQMVDRISRAIASGALAPPAASMMRLLHAEAAWNERDQTVRIAGAHLMTHGGDGTDPLAQVATDWLMRQAGSLGGGSTEMARNIISERLLGMPREFAADRDVPFREVRLGR